LEAPRAAPPRVGFADTLRDAADLALLGIATTIASIPVLTAGGAIAAASAAVHERCAEGDLPRFGTSTRRFVRAVLPGIGATLAFAVLAFLLIADIRAVAAGSVPGGRPLLVATVVATGAVLGFAGLTVVEVGRRGGRGWLPSLRAAVGAGLRRPALLVATAGVGLLGTLIAVFVPVTAPLALGHLLFALHVVAARLAPAGCGQAGGRSDPRRSADRARSAGFLDRPERGRPDRRQANRAPPRRGDRRQRR
jgi:hypothetical protein